MRQRLVVREHQRRAVGVGARQLVAERVELTLRKVRVQVKTACGIAYRYAGTLLASGMQILVERGFNGHGHGACQPHEEP